MYKPMSTSPPKVDLVAPYIFPEMFSGYLLDTVPENISGRQLEGLVAEEAPNEPKRLRVDAVQNRARVLASAKEVFTERGSRASLNEVAKRAASAQAPSIATSRRCRPCWWPSSATMSTRCVGAERELLAHEDPDTGLRMWLRAFAVHASQMQGMLAAQLAVDFMPGDGNALAACHDTILATADQLLDRAKNYETTPPDLDVRDLLRLVNAIAWASHKLPTTPTSSIDFSNITGSTHIARRGSVRRPIVTGHRAR